MRRLSGGVVVLVWVVGWGALAGCDDDGGGAGSPDQGTDVTGDPGGDGVVPDQTGDGVVADQGAEGTVILASAFPLTGDLAAQPAAVDDAIAQAVDDMGGSACGGAWLVQHQSFDHADADGHWDGALAADDANAIADDDQIVAVVGTFNSGAAAAMIPILNEADVVMVSPANTYAGLTQSQGAAEGEPDVFYPSGTRTFARVVGGDHLQARAGALWAADLGAITVYLLDDGELYGAGLAANFDASTGDANLTVIGHQTVSDATDLTALASTIMAADPSLIYFAGVVFDWTVPLFQALDTAGYDGLRMAGDGLYDTAFTADESGIADGFYLTLGGLPPDQLTGDAAAWADAYEARFGSVPPGYAAEAYAATQVIFAAFDRVCAAGGELTDRAAVREEVMGSTAVDTLIGPVTFDANGDITTPVFAGFQVVDGAPVFQDLLDIE